MTDRQPINDAMASRVRGNTINAAIAAAFLLYFGFAVIAEPSGPGLFERSALVFYHTLRIGGVAMVIVLLASLAGHPLALLLDAIAAALIGALLILTGGGMLAGGGGMLQTVINVLCGLMFLSSARHLWADFVSWRTGDPQVAAEFYATPQARTSDQATPPVTPSPPIARTTPDPAAESSPPEPTSLAGRLREQRRSGGSAPTSAANEPSATAPAQRNIEPTTPGSLADVDWSDEPRRELATDPAPDPPHDAGQDGTDDSGTDNSDGGFLASFADDGPPPKP